LELGAVDVQLQRLLVALGVALTLRAASEHTRASWAALSPREPEVCRLFVRGLADAQIGATLGTAVSTVQTQRTRALQKLNVGSWAALVRLLALVDEA